MSILNFGPWREDGNGVIHISDTDEENEEALPHKIGPGEPHLWQGKGKRTPRAPSTSQLQNSVARAEEQAAAAEAAAESAAARLSAANAAAVAAKMKLEEANFDEGAKAIWDAAKNGVDIPYPHDDDIMRHEEGEGEAEGEEYEGEGEEYEGEDEDEDADITGLGLDFDEPPPQ